MELRISKVVFFVLFVASTVSASSEATTKTITTNETSDKSNPNQTLSKEHQLNKTINETRINTTKVSASSEKTILTNEASEKSNINQTVSKEHHLNVTINETRINTTKSSKNDSLNELLVIKSLKPNNASEQTINATESETDFIEYSAANSSNLIYTVDDNQKKDTENTIIEKIVLCDQFYGVFNESEEKTSNLESVELVPGKIAAILAGVFIVIAVIGYVMMLSWRRYFENRYGNREMLTNEDYCEKMNDLDHFSMASYPESSKDSVEPQQMTLIKDKIYIEES